MYDAAAKLFEDAGWTEFEWRQRARVQWLRQR